MTDIKDWLAYWYDKLDLTAVFLIIGKAFLVMIITYAVLKLTRRWVDHALKRSATLKESRRATTLAVIIGSVSKYVLYFIAFIIILSLFNIDIAPILASAGVLGLAIGFGAQNLVKDAISGFFIVFENYYAVGDYIKTGTVSGYVEEIGIRTTKLRDWSGEVHVLPNGEITQVTNYSLGELSSVFNIPLSYESDLGEATALIEEVCEAVKAEYGDKFKDGPRVLGLSELDESRMLVSVIFFAAYADKFALEREIRKRIKEAFDRKGIEMPFYYTIRNQYKDSQTNGEGR